MCWNYIVKKHTSEIINAISRVIDSYKKKNILQIIPIK